MNNCISFNVSYKKETDYYNFGESKGMGFNRVLIYPTEKMKEWILNNATKLTNGTRAKLYVGISRARYSVCFVLNEDCGTQIDGIKVIQNHD